MNRKDFFSILNRYPELFSRFGIDKYEDSKYCIVGSKDFMEVFFYERGVKTYTKGFDSEEEAYEYLFEISGAKEYVQSHKPQKKLWREVNHKLKNSFLIVGIGLFLFTITLFIISFINKGVYIPFGIVSLINFLSFGVYFVIDYYERRDQQSLLISISLFIAGLALFINYLFLMK